MTLSDTTPIWTGSQQVQDTSNIARFMSWLRETGAFAGYLRDVGVKEGDCVVGFIPNIPEAIVAFLAASSIGAIWSVCNQDVAISGVLARFKQLEPTVMIVSDDILEVAGLPHTLTGKRLEVPIKRILLGKPVSQALNLSAVDRPELIQYFANLAATSAKATP